MFEKTRKVKLAIKNLHKEYIENNLASYENDLTEINKINLEYIGDDGLKDMSAHLIERAKNGEKLDNLLVEAFAVAREAARRVTGMRPFDVQVIAAMAMHRGRLVEMQTGEGKTLAAVLPAYLNGLSGAGVHVLTFNDYLANRDADWMGPIYRFLGLSVGYVKEGMSVSDRKSAYACDITYVTAKEAGFDYLKGFLCTDKEQLVHRDFNYVIVDEADSILIDEARIPLVIAGDAPNSEENTLLITKLVRTFEAVTDYDTDEYSRNVFLTNAGIEKAEASLKCGNLYDTDNIGLLTKINSALHAEILLKKDIDYIVRDGKVELVDEFTGRIADKRHWPYGLQAAVEAKEGIVGDAKGAIFDSITLQNFVHLYPKMCGMTGTAQAAGEEFFEFYDIKVAVIPPNKPCIRTDHADIIFTHKEAKRKALVEETVKVHATGRPILIGTSSIEESDQVAHELEKAGVACQILNAKNDELEARIIADAGMPNTVTVSTNMAGRGTDIKLGGENEQEYDKVVALGGLYVIGINRHESRRIDDQLRGRAGRQGDPGSSQFFVSLEDDLMKRYRIDELIPKLFYPKHTDEPVVNPIVEREFSRAQRIIEGQNFDIRKNLIRYSILGERQRQIVHNMHSDLLTGKVIPSMLLSKDDERYETILSRVGEKVVQEVEKKITLHYINVCWMDFLDYMAYVREGVHLVSIGGKTPIDEFNKSSIEAFDEMLEHINEEVEKAFYKAEITENGIDMEKEGIKGPSSTWTYLVSDGAEQFGMLSIVNSPIAVAFSAPFVLGLAMFNKIWKGDKQ